MVNHMGLYFLTCQNIHIGGMLAFTTAIGSVLNMCLHYYLSLIAYSSVLSDLLKGNIFSFFNTVRQSYSMHLMHIPIKLSQSIIKSCMMKNNL